jgi:hypothetical protein
MASKSQRPLILFIVSPGSANGRKNVQSVSGIGGIHVMDGIAGTTPPGGERAEPDALARVAAVNSNAWDPSLAYAPGSAVN